MWFFLDYSNLCYVFLYSFSGAENEPRDIHPLQGLTSSSSVATRDSLSELSSPLAAPSVPPIWGGCNRSSCRSHFGILDPSKGRDRFVMLPRWMQNPSILDIETFCWMGDLHALEVVEDMFLGGGLGFECFDGSGDFGEFYP